MTVFETSVDFNVACRIDDSFKTSADDIWRALEMTDSKHVQILFCVLCLLHVFPPSKCRADDSQLSHHHASACVPPEILQEPSQPLLHLEPLFPNLTMGSLNEEKSAPLNTSTHTHPHTHTRAHIHDTHTHAHAHAHAHHFYFCFASLVGA